MVVWDVAWEPCLELFGFYMDQKGTFSSENCTELNLGKGRKHSCFYR